MPTVLERIIGLRGLTNVRPFPWTVLLAATMLLYGCHGSRADYDDSWLPNGAPGKGDCPYTFGEGGDWGSPIESLLLAERWIKVDADNEALRRSPSADADGALTVPVVGTAVPRHAGITRPSRRESVELQSANLPYLGAAIDHGYDLYLAVTDGRKRHKPVTVMTEAVAVTEDGVPYIASQCGSDNIALPLHSRLGDQYDDRLSRIIGVTDDSEFHSVLEASNFELERPPEGRLSPTAGTSVDLKVVPPRSVAMTEGQFCSSVYPDGVVDCVPMRALHARKVIHLRAWIDEYQESFEGVGSPALDIVPATGYPAVDAYGIPVNYSKIYRHDRNGVLKMTMVLPGRILRDGYITLDEERPGRVEYH